MRWRWRFEGSHRTNSALLEIMAAQQMDLLLTHVSTRCGSCKLFREHPGFISLLSPVPEMTSPLPCSLTLTGLQILKEIRLSRILCKAPNVRVRHSEKNTIHSILVVVRYVKFQPVKGGGAATRVPRGYPNIESPLPEFQLSVYKYTSPINHQQSCKLDNRSEEMNV